MIASTCALSSEGPNRESSIRRTRGRRSISASHGRSGCRRCSSSVRYVPTTTRRSVRTLRARKATRSRVELSAQCRSSRTHTTGARSPRSRRSARTPSKILAWAHSGRPVPPASATAGAPNSGRSRPSSAVAGVRRSSNSISRNRLPASVAGSLRSASTIGAYGRPPPSPRLTQPPSRRSAPPSRARAPTSSISRVLPMPASPPMRMTAASPALARSTASIRASRSG